MFTEKPRGSVHGLIGGSGSLRIVLACLLCVPPLITLAAIIWYGANIPYYDDWYFTGTGLDRLLQGKLTLGFFFEPIMEHRILLPKLILMCLALITHWNIKIALVTSWLTVVIIYGLILRQLQRSISARPTGPFFVAGLIGCLLFGLIQWEIWTWSCTLLITLNGLLLVTAVLLAMSSLLPKIRFILSAILALIATYSSGNGLLLWILLPPVLLANGFAKKDRRSLFAVIWVLCAAASVLPYVFNLPSAATNEATREQVSLWELFAFVVRYVGSSIGSGSSDALARSFWIGTAFIVLWLAAMAYVIRRGSAEMLRTCVPWICLGAYSIMTGALISFARARYGDSLATSSRYIGYSVYLPVSLLCLALILMPHFVSDLQSAASRRYARYTFFGLLLAVFLLHIRTTLVAQTWLDVAKAMRAEEACTLHFIKLVPPGQIATVLHPEPQVLLNSVDRLNSAGYIHPPVATTDRVDRLIQNTEVTAGQIERVERVGDQINLLGWAAPKSSSDRVDAVAITYTREDGAEILISISTGLLRLDTDKPLDALLSPVWHASFPIDRLPNGKSRISLWRVSAKDFHFSPIEGHATIER